MHYEDGVHGKQLCHLKCFFLFCFNIPMANCFVGHIETYIKLQKNTMLLNFLLSIFIRNNIQRAYRQYNKILIIFMGLLKYSYSMNFNKETKSKIFIKCYISS